MVQVLPASDCITILTVPKLSESICPLCAVVSGRVHSHYTRTLADLPWQGRRAAIQVRARRFCCDNTYQCSSFSLRQDVRSMRLTRPACRSRIASSAAGVSGIR